MIILLNSELPTFAEWLQAASAIVTILGVVVIVLSIRGYGLSQNQFRQGVMTHCLNRYYTVMFDKKGEKYSDPDVWLQQLFELINEEMFYFQVKYLPMDVIIEWMDGILDNVIIRKAGSAEIINERALVDIIKNSVKQSCFPRLTNAFTIKSGVDYSPAFDRENPAYAETRKRLIIEILTNLWGKISDKDRKAVVNTKLVS
jgi:hypothetical protein